MMHSIVFTYFYACRCKGLKRKRGKEGKKREEGRGILQQDE